MTAETKRTEGMRAFTVHRPWSHAIAHLGKDVENRSKPTKYRGLVAIHGGKKWSDDAAAWCEWQSGYTFDDNDMTRGHGIVAVADLVGCHAAELDFTNGQFVLSYCESDWAFPTGFHWKLANVRPLPEPVPCKGRQGLWRLPEDVERTVWSALAGAVA